MPTLEDHLVFYRQYHFNTVNVAVHLVGIPTILGSFIALLSLVDLPIGASPHLFTNLGMVMAVSYSVYYVLLDALGLAVAPLLVGLAYYIKHTLVPTLSSGTVAKYALYCQLGGWGAQFIGHGVFEKRAPALLDDLAQALLYPPLFVAFEVAWMMGFRMDIKKRMDNRAGVLLAEFRKKHPKNGPRRA